MRLLNLTLLLFLAGILLAPILSLLVYGASIIASALMLP